MKKLLLLLTLCLVITTLPRTYTLGQAIPPNVDRQKVVTAIEKGTNYLLTAIPYGSNPSFRPYQPVIISDEFVLFTLVHVDADRNHGLFRGLLNRILKSSNNLPTTYRACTLATKPIISGSGH